MSTISEAWENPCKEVLTAYRQLRHRNAHPDWLTTSDGGESEPAMEKSLDAMIRLAWFYGYMILALAKFEDLRPEFPGPHRDWPALMTITKEDPPSPNNAC